MIRRLLVALAGLYALGAVLPRRRGSAARAARVVSPSPPASARAATPAPPVAERAPEHDPAPTDNAVVTRGATTVVRAVRAALRRNITDVAAGLAYYAFLAIPSLLLVAVGVFALTTSDRGVTRLTERLDGVVPDEAITLIQDSLTRVASDGGGLGLIGVGLLLALWSASGAMNALMRGLNAIWDTDETRSFVIQRATALGLLAWSLLALLLAFGLLVLGAPLSRAVGDAAGLEALVSVLWWTAQWPILIGGLLLAVWGILRLGPDVDRRGARVLSPGAAVAILVWLVASGGFALYTANLGSYNATWGSLAGVIVLLTWLWLSALAVLLGAAVDAQIERDAAGAAGRDGHALS